MRCEPYTRCLSITQKFCLKKHRGGSKGLDLDKTGKMFNLAAIETVIFVRNIIKVATNLIAEE